MLILCHNDSTASRIEETELVARRRMVWLTLGLLPAQRGLVAQLGKNVDHAMNLPRSGPRSERS